MQILRMLRRLMIRYLQKIYIHHLRRHLYQIRLVQFHRRRRHQQLLNIEQNM
jgi:hypothetical protein